MSKADDAYREAERRIAEDPDATGLNLSIKNLETIPPEIANLTNLTALDLSNTQISSAEPFANLTNLTALYLLNTQISSAEPIAKLTKLTELYLSGTQISSAEPIANLTNLTVLDLGDTQISSAEPIANLTKLTTLALSNSQITDLRPIKNLELLIGEGIPGNLYFRNCAATHHDSKLKALSEIENIQERTRDTLAYLNSLPDTSNSLPAKPDQDRALKVQLASDNKLDAEPAQPDAKELEDHIKRACHEQLRDATADFIAASGNQHHRLTKRARRFFEKLDQPFAKLNMLDLHFGIEMLANVYATRDERKGEDILSPEMITTLDEIARVGPGLVRDNPEVEAFENRRTRDDDAKVPENQDDKDALLEKISASDEIIGELLRGYANQAKGQDPNSKRGFAGTVINRNTIIAATAAIATGVAINRADALVLWLYQNYEIVVAVSQPYGQSMMAWVLPIMDAIRQSGGTSYQAFKKVLEKTTGHKS